MKPLKLRLRHFIGIRDGLGKDEITIDLERAVCTIRETKNG